MDTMMNLLVYHPDISIQKRVDQIQQYRSETQEEDTLLYISNRIKNIIQREIVNSVVVDNKINSSIVIAATGVGKSKAALEIIKEAVENNIIKNVLIVVPTEDLRDNGWREEAEKWGFKNLYEKYVTTICYASLQGMEGEKWDLVIMDECHNITINNSTFFCNNQITSTVGLTATYPRDITKRTLLSSYIGNVCYRIDTDTAVKLGVVSPYEIIVVKVPLEGVHKTVKAGNKNNPFYTTESKNMAYLDARCYSAPNKRNYLLRMRFIYNLRSKTIAAKWILDNLISENERCLIFCGSKIKANELCENRYYSKPSKPKTGAKDYARKMQEYQEELSEYQGDASLLAFKDKRINRLSCVSALNEGQNISEIDSAVADQITSNELDLIQRIGRIIRYRNGHRGKIYILCAEGTVDVTWINKATEKLKENVRWINFSELKQAQLEKEELTQSE